jgi:endonuclease V-like protein UPF0215 family
MVYEQTICLPEQKDGTVPEFRRITVTLKQPSRDDDSEIHILTNLPEADANAVTTAELYRKRWAIECQRAPKTGQ